MGRHRTEVAPLPDSGLQAAALDTVRALGWLIDALPVEERGRVITALRDLAQRHDDDG